jgi:outer membrane protein assembly factor BamB
MPRILLVCAALAATALLARGGDWPQFLGPTRNAVAADVDLRADWPAGGPPKLWEYPIGHGWSGPVVADGKLILFHRVGDEEIVECLEAATGKAVWKAAAVTDYRDDFGFDDGPRATPVIAGGRVFTFGAAGRLQALDLTAGKTVWERNVRTDYNAPKGYFGAACSPLLDEGRLLLNVGGPGAGVVALDAATGKELWKATDDAASYSSPAMASLAGKRTAVFLTRQGLLGLDPATGVERFRQPWRARLQASVNAATPLIVGDQVFVSASYGTGAGLFAVGADGLKMLWKNDAVLSNHYNTSVESQGFLYGIDGRQEGGGAALRCVEWATGKARWGQERFGCASLIRAGDKLLALTENGELVLFDATPEAYRERARAKVFDTTCRAAPALADGRFYARDTQKLVCIDLRK